VGGLGYRDLAKLITAIERHTTPDTNNNNNHQEQAEPITV
jgi:hypothetical protein